MSQGKKLYVGNLKWTVDEDALRKLCASYGTIGKVQIITDRDTGKSRGFGFVEFADPAEADAAIEALHGRMIDGRTLTVNEARERTTTRR